MITPEFHIVDELENSLSFKKSLIPKSLLLKPEINTLVVYALTDWLMIMLFCMAAWFLPLWCYPVLAILLGSRYHSLGVILHDAVHMPLKRKTARYRFLEILTGYPIGSTINAMRYHHLRHHKDSGMHTDPYFKKGIEGNKVLKYLFIFRAVILIPFWTVRGIYGTMAFYIPHLRNSYSKIFLQDKSGNNFTHNAEVIQCAGEDRWQLLYHLILYSMIIWAPAAFVFFYAIPVLICGIFSGYRLINEHKYVETSDRKLETIIATTKDNHLSGVLKYFLAPKNIGYHSVHHLHPQVAWYKLPQLRKWYLENKNDVYTNK